MIPSKGRGVINQGSGLLSRVVRFRLDPGFRTVAGVAVQNRDS